MKIKRILSAALAEIRVNRKYLTANLIISACAAIMLLVNTNVQEINGMYMKTSNTYYDVNIDGLSFALFAGAAFAGIAACIHLFRDMHNKRESDVLSSMPISAGERFLSKLSALLCINILPIALFSAGSMAAAYLKITAMSPGLSADTLLRTRNIFLYLFLEILQLVLFTDAITIFCTCCCGAFAESIYTSVITIGCMSFMPSFFFKGLIEKYAGLRSGEGRYPFFISSWSYSSILHTPFDIEFEGFAAGFQELFMAIGLSAAVIIAAGMIYSIRDGRRVGNSMAFGWFFEGFLFMGVFSVLVVAAFSSSFYIGLVIALICSVIVRVIASRAHISVKSAFAWALKYAAAVVLFFAAAVSAAWTDGYGYYRYIPDSDKPSELEVSLINQVYYPDWERQDSLYYCEKSTDTISEAEMPEYQKKIISDLNDIIFPRPKKSLSEIYYDIIDVKSLNSDNEKEVCISRYDDDGFSDSYTLSIIIDDETWDRLEKYLEDNDAMYNVDYENNWYVEESSY